MQTFDACSELPTAQGLQTGVGGRKGVADAQRLLG